jgi:hypothetical protein
MNQSHYVIVENDPNKQAPLVIRDVGPWDHYMTVTNDAERVVNELVHRHELPPGRRLLYYDSEGTLTEIVIDKGKFAYFKFVNQLSR